jgi:catechol 2,3-dioxygenase-like lactoylglutathione lyase family enzyme
MRPPVSVVTLGVDDLDRAVAFYRALGWEPDNDFAAQEVAFYQSAGMVFALWDRKLLTEDSGVVDSGGWGGVTMAHNVGSPDEVDSILERARAAGATLAREAGRTFYGGYSGVFVDPDGHPWEVAHNPHWTLEADGSVRL